MTWNPIAFLPPQYGDSDGAPYSGAVLKAYADGTTNVISMATDNTGATTVTSFALNAAGYPVSGGAVIIPHIQENYKLALYPDQSSADANSGAVWTVDNITIAEAANTAFVQTFSGDGSTVEFTLTEDLGTDENTIMVFADISGTKRQIHRPDEYTLANNTLTFDTAPVTGTNNIIVFAPSLLFGAVEGSAAAAATSEANALAYSNIAKSAAGYAYGYDTVTTATDPGDGKVQFDDTDLTVATTFYINDETANSQDISAEIESWGDSTSTVKGTLRMFKQNDATIFALFEITGAVVDNTGWHTLTVSHVSSSGSFTDEDGVTIQFIRNGDKGDTGDTGPQGPTGTVSGSTPTTPVTGDKLLFLDVSSSDGLADATISDVLNLAPDQSFKSTDITGRTDTAVAASDEIVYADASDGGNLKKDTIQGILDLVSGSGRLIDYQVFTSSGTWTKPAGCNAVKVTVVGGGGAGAYSTDGGSGGTSSFGSHCSASGGSGGVGGTNSFKQGARGGVGSNGDINGRGGPGDCVESSGNGDGTNGGDSLFGGGGRGNGSGSPSAGDAYGGGGAGAISGSTFRGSSGGGGGFSIKHITSVGATESVTVGSGGTHPNGGNGASGVVIVESYT